MQSSSRTRGIFRGGRLDSHSLPEMHTGIGCAWCPACFVSQDFSFVARKILAKVKTRDRLALQR
jgi:hypothetical protein